MSPAQIAAENAVDSCEAEIATVDVLAHRTFGRDESRWTHGQRDAYIEAITTVYQQHGQVAA